MNNTLTKFKAAPSSATSVSLVKARNQSLSYYDFIKGLFPISPIGYKKTAS